MSLLLLFLADGDWRTDTLLPDRSLQGRISQELWEHLRAQVVREAEAAVKDDAELEAAIGHCLPRRG